MFSSPHVVVHGLEQARSTLRPGLPVVLLSAPSAASFAGCGWWRALIAAARAEYPGAAPQAGWSDLLDCGAAPGYAMSALRIGQRALVLDPACPGFPAVAAAAAALSAVVLPARPASLDMSRLEQAGRGADRRLLAWLQGDSGAAGPG
jgi:hypothetical protein